MMRLKIFARYGEETHHLHFTRSSRETEKTEEPPRQPRFSLFFFFSLVPSASICRQNALKIRNRMSIFSTADSLSAFACLI